MYKPVILLLISNVFMTFAWYGHLKNLQAAPLWMVIVGSWSIAFFEYCFQVPGNRLGSLYFSLPQLKVMQEIIAMVVFAGFSVWYMKVPVTRNYILAGMLLAAAAYLIFSDHSSSGNPH
ncbi:DMT family protein [Capilliphycus salinus ALCB114379]|uniref:DMT family protein n=1 Tax=Capilliphycus salinus TaxID=2768948 RepID=UPI002C4737B9|nr:DMT family protein [Lyngbya sp.]